MKTKIAIFFIVGSSFCMLAQGGMKKGYSFPQVPGHVVDTTQTFPAVEPENQTKTVHVSDSLRQPEVETDTLLLPDSLRAGVVSQDSLRTDSIQEDTMKVSKSVLDQPVEYTASDSVTFEAGVGNANLYGNSKVNYLNLELQADWITMNMDSSIVHAVGRTDSTGNVKGQPVFKQGEDQYEPEKISYNFKTRKAFINNVYTQQGDGYLISNESKRDGEGVMYLRHGKYTTL